MLCGFRNSLVGVTYAEEIYIVKYIIILKGYMAHTRDLLQREDLGHLKISYVFEGLWRLEHEVFILRTREVFIYN